MSWRSFAIWTWRRNSKRTEKRLERMSEECRFWEMQYDLLLQRCAPYGVIDRAQFHKQALSERAKSQLDAFCRAAVLLSRHWDEALDAGYPFKQPFDEWVGDVLLPWQKRIHQS